MNTFLRFLSLSLAIAAVACTGAVAGAGGGGAGGGGNGCTGYTVQYCSGGTIQTGCCPPQADCWTQFCDLGDGTCVAGTCPGADAGDACKKGSISAASFDQSCSTAADCEPVYEGTLCTQCLCPTAAINQGALMAYYATLQDAGPPTSTCDCSAIPAPVCAASGASDGGGVCTLP